ncbi:MAG TPA: hypothetical protein VJH34_04255 [archaeon]|nr:hypothetical protein [archaeon]
MSLEKKLYNHPILYEVVPPKLDLSLSDFRNKLNLLKSVLDECKIDAFNVPEIIDRREIGGRVLYEQSRLAPEEYASLIALQDREVIVNIVAPRLPKDIFIRRVENIVNSGIYNIVVVGKEKNIDNFPGPNVVEALDIISSMNKSSEKIVPGGITMFQRNYKENHGYAVNGSLNEYQRIAIKAKHGCRFVTSQIIFDSKDASDFFSKYKDYHIATSEDPITVFISLSTIASEKVLDLMGYLGVYISDDFRKELKANYSKMGELSVEHSVKVLGEIIDSMREKGSHKYIPIGLQIEQVGSNGKSTDLSLELLDRTYGIIKCI